jgi:enamine deaminase RidA (YjgF/YER057c/UK114 family)
MEIVGGSSPSVARSFKRTPLSAARFVTGNSRVRLMTARTTHLDPKELHSNPAFTQGVIAPAGQTLYVGGQLGTDSTGRLLDGIEAQATQAMRNVLTVLAAAGTGPEHVAKLNIYLVDGVDAQAGYEASRSVWGNHRTAITVVSTAGHARPGALVEIDAIAIIPEEDDPTDRAAMV